ncbi:MAG TPA: hotdog fold thioesterase, partial [Bacteroidales bacterium]
MINENSTLAELNAINKGTMMEHLHIEYLEVRKGFVKAQMPVNEKTKQPAGILHGGANVVLAETVGGLGSLLLVDFKQFDVRGSQISANHVGTAHTGFVFAEANIIHEGKNTHVWNIDIRDEEGRLISTCRLTNFIIKRNSNATKA